MANVYLTRIGSYSEKKKISDGAKALLERLLKDEKIALEKEIPLKVHFGEHGNITYISPDRFDGMIDLLEQHKVKGIFMETNATYSGHRMMRSDHAKLAKEHGFTRLPVVIADGDHGDEFTEVKIDKKHFRSCKIGKAFSGYRQMLVISHFKGHGLAGFGGALKQLSMGCASRGGKLAMHVDSKPIIIPFLCKKCRTCVGHCPAGAIRIGFYSRIDHKKCIGCASCIAVCPHKAVLVNPFKLSLSGRFYENLAEYAYAAQLGKKNIYISFAFNITKGCDCIGSPMKPFAKDLGVLASTDPVSLDTACLDLVEEQEGKKVFKGRHILDYAEKIGLGSKSYKLIKV